MAERPWTSVLPSERLQAYLDQSRRGVAYWNEQVARHERAIGPAREAAAKFEREVEDLLAEMDSRDLPADLPASDDVRTGG